MTITRLMRNKNHHYKKSDNNSIEGKYISKTSDTIFYGIAFTIEVPPPSTAHNDR